MPLMLSETNEYDQPSDSAILCGLIKFIRVCSGPRQVLVSHVPSNNEEKKPNRLATQKAKPPIKAKRRGLFFLVGTVGIL